MIGATLKQVLDVARAAQEVGGYFQLIAQANSTPAKIEVSTPDGPVAETPMTPTFTIDKDTHQVRLVAG